MNKNISCVFLLTTLILFLGLSVVCASDINSCAYDSVSDLEKVNNIKDNTVNKITDNNDNNIKEIKRILIIKNLQYLIWTIREKNF